MSVGLAKEEYTVGWICALSTELTAAMAMLDEIHPSLPRSSSDTNTYVLGRVGVHNVVIACLPQGRTGITSAAIAANLMKHTFSSIQFSLMVGIGGGVPSVLHDIRLGDVVVSTPSLQSGGVVQYDFGKTIAEGRFVRTNVLAPPPTVLLTAISLLRARHEAFGNQLTHYLSAVSSPKLQLKYTYQGAQHDQLFVAEYDHIGDVDCEKCDDSKLVMRLERDSLDPVAHYGTIASASQVMRHGGTRDRLGSELDVLCFEMEAAGLMNDFPCVVIRGVSDYADSHKNKRWQGYAAATAAAYAKELLSTIPPLERSVTPAIDNQLGYRNEHYLVPHNVSSMFTGRDDICQLLRERCLRSEKHGGMEVLKVFVLYGLGGSGKTQVCLKFAHDHREEFWGIFWIDASNDETAERGFLDIADICGFEKDFESTKRRLSNMKERWLLIIDNADDPSINISKYFPTGNRGTILVTTRNYKCESHQTVGSWESGQMELKDAVALLLKTTAMEDRADDALLSLAKSIVEDLGCLALAIAQAGAFIREQHYGMEEYRGVYSRNRRILLSRQPTQASSNYKYTVYTTWEVSVEKIASMLDQTARNAIEILKLFSFLHFDGISEQIFREAWVNMRRSKPSEWILSRLLSVLPQIESTDWDPQLFREAVSLLATYSLISVRREDDHTLFSMHPLVHTWSRDRLEEEQKKCWLMSTVTLGMSVSRRFQFRDYKFRRSLLPHLDSCFKFHQGEQFINSDGGKECLWAASRLALVYSGNCRFEEAKTLQEKVLEVLRRTSGEDQPKTLQAMTDLAATYDSLQRSEEAKNLKEKLVQIQSRKLGESHRKTLKSMRGLAITYNSLGRFEEAKQLGEKAIEVQIKTLGEDDPDTLCSMMTLAATHGLLGRFEEAKRLAEKALKESTGTSGEDHPSTPGSIDGPAFLHRFLDHFEEAKRLKEQIANTRTRTLGEDHSNTLSSIHNLAFIYNHLGLSEEAKQLREELEAQSRALGVNRPDALASTSSLAFPNSYPREATPSENKIQKRPLDESQSTAHPLPKHPRPSHPPP
ncbi:MAG: hypothetical protein M1813_009214 [Trichoglossum hirsutum]|nr:MAG: hypothetical protein M1813_009214 [Trichoglossum hirsutum]